MKKLEFKEITIYQNLDYKIPELLTKSKFLQCFENVFLKLRFYQSQSQEIFEGNLTLALLELLESDQNVEIEIELRNCRKDLGEYKAFKN